MLLVNLRIMPEVSRPTRHILTHNVYITLAKAGMRCNSTITFQPIGITDLFKESAFLLAVKRHVNVRKHAWVGGAM